MKYFRVLVIYVLLHALRRTCNTGSMRVHSNYLYSIFSVRYTYTVILITNS